MPSNAPAPVTAKKSPTAPKTPLTKKSPSVKTAARLAEKTAGKGLPKASSVPVKDMLTAAPKVAPSATTSSPMKAPTNAGVSPAGAANPVLAAPGKTKSKGAAKEPKASKPKLVRDSFTFPEEEYRALVGMKKRLLAAGHEAKKGELVRAGMALLSRLDDAALVKALAEVEKLKAGRPAK